MTTSQPLLPRLRCRRRSCRLRCRRRSCFAVYIHVLYAGMCIRLRAYVTTFVAATASTFVLRRRRCLLPPLLREERKEKIHTGMYTCRCIYISYVRKPLVPPRLCFVAHGACFLSCSAHSENHNLYIHVGVYLVYIKHVRAHFAATTASTSFFVDDGACFYPCSAQSLAVRFSASK